jgi:hypothetical protein
MVLRIYKDIYLEVKLLVSNKLKIKLNKVFFKWKTLAMILDLRNIDLNLNRGKKDLYTEHIYATFAIRRNVIIEDLQQQKVLQYLNLNFNPYKISGIKILNIKNQ